MKKYFALLMSFVLLLSITACGSSTSETSAGKPSGNAKESSSEIKVDEGLLSVDITMPAACFKDETEEDIKKAAEEKGYSGCVINEDGSVTYTMTKKQYKEQLEQLEKGMEETFASMLTGEDALDSFVSIDHTDDFLEINIHVDPAKYSNWDHLFAPILYNYGAYYQFFKGIEADKVNVVVNFVNNDTKEVLYSCSYKDSKSRAESDESAESSEESEGIQTADVTALAVQETKEVPDVCEFFVDYTAITSDVVPPSPDNWYSHYEAEDGKVFIDLCVGYKNLSTKDQHADEVMKATLLYGGKYQYDGFSAIEEGNRSDFTYSNITDISPLSLEYLHYLFEVPASVETSDGSLTALISIGDSQYGVTVREGTEGEVDAVNENAVAKTSGEVKKGEIIAVMNTCEFYVDFSDITDDVIPPHPDGSYSHYPADDGKAYVDFCVAYKSWKTKAVSADKVISATLTYAGKYEYRGSSAIEDDGRSDFTYSNITSIAPLATEYLHYLFEVPAEVATGTEPITIDFSIGGNSYSYTVR